MEKDELKIVYRSAKEKIEEIEKEKAKNIVFLSGLINRVQVEADEAIKKVLEKEKEEKENIKEWQENLKEDFFIVSNSKKNKLRIETIFDNAGREIEIISGLKKGDKVKCIKGVLNTGVNLKGNKFWATKDLVEGKVYKVETISIWGGVKVAYVENEDGVLDWITPEIFAPVGKIEVIRESKKGDEFKVGDKVRAMEKVGNVKEGEIVEITATQDMKDEDGKVHVINLLVERENDPCAGRWVFPDKFVKVKEGYETWAVSDKSVKIKGNE